ncbi:hypothetical protein Tco_0385187, partial [Tanacetum coccineum]
SFSSLIAFGLKQGIRTARGGEFRVEVSDGTIAHVNLRVLGAGILTSAAGLVFGCLFLTLALVVLVEIKLGKLACLDWYGLASVVPLVVLVPSALVFFMSVLCYMRALASLMHKVTEPVSEVMDPLQMKSGSGFGTKSLYERWKDTLDDDPYDDDECNAYDLSEEQMVFCDALIIKLRGRIKK